MISLYTLSKEMQEIIHWGYDAETTQELLEWYNIIGAEQIEDIVKAIRTNEATIAGYDLEIKRLQDAKKRFSDTNGSLERMVDRFLQSTQQTSFDTSIAKISYRKSESVVIDDETLLSDEYMRVKTTKEPDKIAIKERLKKWVIVEGVRIEVKQNLQIK